MKRLTILELVLAIFALVGMIGSITFGVMDVRLRTYPINEGAVNITHETGWNGGAIAMGIIGAASLVSIVLIELAKFRKENKLD